MGGQLSILGSESVRSIFVGAEDTMAELLEQVKSLVEGIGLVGHRVGLGLDLLRGGGRNRRGCDQRQEGKLQKTIHGDCCCRMEEYTDESGG